MITANGDDEDDNDNNDDDDDTMMVLRRSGRKLAKHSLGEYLENKIWRYPSRT